MRNGRVGVRLHQNVESSEENTFEQHYIRPWTASKNKKASGSGEFPILGSGDLLLLTRFDEY